MQGGQTRWHKGDKIRNLVEAKGQSLSMIIEMNFIKQMSFIETQNTFSKLWFM